VEHASLAYAALATRKIDAPVMRVSDRNVDHAYVVIGDPRDPRWGEKNTVVVDPWVRYPTSFTLSESGSLNHTPFMPAVVEREPGSAPDPDAVDLLRSVRPVSTAEVEQMLAENDLPPIGDALVEHINENVGRRLHLYDVRTGASDPSVKYSDSRLSRGKTMDKITRSVVARGKDAERALQRNNRG